MNYLRKTHKDFTLNGEIFESVEKLLIFSKSISKETFSFLHDWFNDSDVVSVQTSGSTGSPKRIQLKKSLMVNSALATGNYFNVFEKTKSLLCISPGYIAGKMMLVRALVLGWHLDIIEPDSHPLDHTINEYNFCAMVPLQLRNSLTQLHRIKKVIVGGASISNELIDHLRNIRTKVYATYGMTETATHIAIKPLNNTSTDNLIVNRSDGHKAEMSLFTVLPNIKISTDNRNCLVIDAPKVSDKKIVTNDLVNLISDTQFKWLGRYDNIINSGGVKLNPEQIESKLSKLISNRFFITGIPDKVLGNKLILVLESSDLKFEIEQLKDKFSNMKSLQKYEIPRDILLVRKFAETKSKKIQRQKTLDLLNI